MITTLNDDAAPFIRSVERVIELAKRSAPSELYVVRINNWFGKKWVAFAGKVGGAFGVSYLSEMVAPPFVPNRVVDQTLLVRNEDGRYVVSEVATDLHATRSSEDNMKRKLSKLFPTTAFVWFSSKSATNGRGSVLAIVPSPNGHVPWFAEFNERKSWKASALVGLTATEVDESNNSVPAAV